MAWPKAVKLIVQIPCLNEEKTLPIVLEAIPRKIAGIDEIEVLVIDDGSTDDTSLAARRSRVEHLLRFNAAQGLARAFIAGIDEALKLGADIIVNIDGDNQYKGEDIPRLIAPILAKRCDMVIGARRLEQIKHFRRSKKFFQRLGGFVVRRITHTNMPDVTSGFRAYSREAALRLNVVTDFTYTLETLIQAAKENITMEYIWIDVNSPTRPSRLFDNMWQYIRRSIGTIIRVYAMYDPLRFFSYLGGILIFGGIIMGLLDYKLLCLISIVLGLETCFIGILADLVSANRRMIERLSLRMRYDKEA